MTPTGAKDNSTTADAPAPVTHVQQSWTSPPVTNPQPPKKSRRKLNRAIFDVDTAAALRIKAQVEPPIVGTKNPAVPEVTVKQIVGAVTLPDPLLKGPSEGSTVDHPPDMGNVAGEQLRTQSKDVSCRIRPNAVSQLIVTGAR